MYKPTAQADNTADKMLNNGVDMNIKLTRAPGSFYILAPSDDNEVQIKSLDTPFLSPKSNETPLFLAQANVLCMKHKAHCPLTHTQIKTFTAISGPQQVSIDTWTNSRKDSYIIRYKHSVLRFLTTY